MKQEFVTLPREVVEQAIEALFCTDSEEGSTAYKNELKAVKKLREALEQPQANQPAMTPIAQRKLDSLLASGYKISGYSIYHELKHQHGFVTGAGLVGWWKPDGVEYPQPQVEQEPVGFVRQVDIEHLGNTPSDWASMFGQATGYNTVPVYTSQLPKLETLTDEEIDKLCPQFDDSMHREMWIIGFKAAHNIK